MLDDWVVFVFAKLWVGNSSIAVSFEGGFVFGGNEYAPVDFFCDRPFFLRKNACCMGDGEFSKSVGILWVVYFFLFCRGINGGYNKSTFYEISY